MTMCILRVQNSSVMRIIFATKNDITFDALIKFVNKTTGIQATVHLISKLCLLHLSVNHLDKQRLKT